jgi:hypothetical protein
MLSLLGSAAVNMSATVNKHARIEDTKFSVWSMLYKEDQLDKPAS